MKLLNSKGEEIVLNEREKRSADVMQRMCNALGFEINITTLTTVQKQIIEQKFFEVKPSDYMPVRVGEGSWSTSLTTFRQFSVADDFATGMINQGLNNGRLAQADAGVDSVNIKVNNWAKEIGYNVMELQIASKSGNWDLVTAREKSRKRNWDLGIQRIAFLGLTGDSSVLGLLNQSGITNDTTTITKKISSMSATELGTFCQVILDKYRTNCLRTAWPTHFVIPESDYLGLAAPSSDTMPLKSKLQILLETFQTMTSNPNFKILPLAYGDTTYGGPATASRYVLYKSDEDTIRMDIPVDYTATQANSLNGFSFQNVAYGQFTGVMVYRPLEVMYFSF